MSRPIRGFGALPSFAAAARWQSFTAAAEELGGTQAAISHQVRELEDQLAVKLLDRTRRAAGRVGRVDGGGVGTEGAVGRASGRTPSCRGRVETHAAQSPRHLGAVLRLA